MKKLLTLFLTFFKIGAFTFGGGYAMAALLENEFTERRHWLDREEFLDITAIAESTPGPIAVNCATYIGFKSAGVAGALCATVGVCLPSFIIIYVISLFFDRFLQLKAVMFAFKGVKACVVYLIISAGVKMMKMLDRSPFNTAVFAAVTAAMLLVSFFGAGFSSVIYILLSGAAGLCLSLVKRLKTGEKKNDIH